MTSPYSIKETLPVHSVFPPSVVPLRAFLTAVLSDSNSSLLTGLSYYKWWNDVITGSPFLTSVAVFQHQRKFQLSGFPCINYSKRSLSAVIWFVAPKCLFQCFVENSATGKLLVTMETVARGRGHSSHKHTDSWSGTPSPFSSNAGTGKQDFQASQHQFPSIVLIRQMEKPRWIFIWLKDFYSTLFPLDFKWPA